MKIHKMIITVGSIIGLFDTFYLVEGHYSGSIACPTNQQLFLGLPIDCGTVDQSKYSEFLGLPLALYGFFYYLAIFLIIYFEERIMRIIQELNIEFLHQKPIEKLVTGLSSLGFLFSLYLVHLQINVLEVICKYCMYSAITTTIICITSWLSLFTPITS